MYNNKRVASSEKGQVIVLLVAGIITLFAFTSLAIDGGRYYSDRRKVQGAVDSAVMSAALAMCQGEDPAQAAEYAASLGGYTDDQAHMSVTYNTPPTEGVYAGQSGYIEVVIEAGTEGTFSKILGIDWMDNTVRAVAKCDQSSTGNVVTGSALVSLNPTKKHAFKVSGLGDVVVQNGGIFVNSNHDEAIKASGKGTATADSISVVGWVHHQSLPRLTPTPTKVSQITDPLAGLAPPPKPSGPCNPPINVPAFNDMTIDPGLYCGIHLSAMGNLTMNPGVYWFESGGMHITGQGDLIANGVLIYMGPGTDGVKITGQGDFQVTPPTSGDYQGLAVFQHPDNSSDLKVTGQGGGFISGTWYAPSAEIEVRGQGDLIVHAQLIGDTIDSTGTGDLIIVHNPDGNYQPAGPSTISLME